MNFLELRDMAVMQVELNRLLAGEDWRDKDWQMAILAEAAELADWTKWKWWANQEKNEDQIRIELADIWFFALSIIAKNGVKEYKDPFEDDETAVTNPIEAIKDIVYFTLYDVEDNNNIIACFLTLCETLGVPFSEVKTYYYGKYALNKLRYDKGYKKGEYEKYWNGKEDNLVMVESIKNGMTYDQIGIFLRETYENTVENTNG